MRSVAMDGHFWGSKTRSRFRSPPCDVEEAIKDDRTTIVSGDSRTGAKPKHPPRWRCASNDLEPWVQVGEPAQPSGFPHVADMHTSCDD